MGAISLDPGSRVYVDANAFIYKVERVFPFHERADRFWREALDKNCAIITSEPTILEVSVGPLKANNRELLADFMRFLSASPITLSPIDRATLERAAQLRSTHRMKTPDAIHAATFVNTGCTRFVTADAGFREIAGSSLLNLAD